MNPAVAPGPGLRRSAAEALRRLPRETRDTLFLLLVIAITVGPHLLHLPPWCAVMVGFVLLWRARIALAGAALPGRWAVTALLVAAVGLTLWGERSMFGKEAGVTMLAVLMSLKTLELRARRDALVVFFLGFFLVLTHFLYSQSLPSGLWMLLSLWGLLTSLVLAHMPVGRPPLATAAAVAARTTALGLPVMALLFVLFPRIGPLWGLPQDAQGRTGLSGTLRLGGVAEVAEDDSIAFRVRFLGPAPPAEQIYFRGPVLSAFDGREWTRGVPTVPVSQRPRADLRPSAPALRYEMTLEPMRLPLLPLLELTPDTPGLAPTLPGWMALLRPDAQWQTDRPIAERVRIEAGAGCRRCTARSTRCPGCATTCACHQAPTPAPGPGRWRCASNPGSPRPTPPRLPPRCCSTSARRATATRLRRAPTAPTRWTSSGSSARPASASTSPRPSWS